MKNAASHADRDTAGLLNRQIGLLTKEFLRQCGTDDEGKPAENCNFDLDGPTDSADSVDSVVSTDSAPRKREPRKGDNREGDRLQQLGGVQDALRNAISVPNVPDAKAKEQPVDGHDVTRQQYQTQLLTGLYAAICPAAGGPDINELMSQGLIGDDGASLGKDKTMAKHIDDIDAVLDSVYAGIQGSGIALAIDDGGNAQTISAAGDDLRVIRDALTDLRGTADKSDRYTPPAGFSLAPKVKQPASPKQAAGFMKQVVDIPLSQLRQLSGRAGSPENRRLFAELAGALGRAQGRIELSQGDNPTDVVIRGGESR